VPERHPHERPQPDHKGEQAAKKVRRTAELRDAHTLGEAETNEIATNDAEAHAELERSKHYKGRPDRS
jgi:hypothetical protein